MGLQDAIKYSTSDKAKFELEQQYKRKALLLSKQNAAYKDYCSRNELKPLNDRLQIARWDRQQAAQARGAARRYENERK